MRVVELELPGVVVVEPRIFADARGWFMESWNAARYEELGIAAPFVQDNVSFSRRGVLRGLHFQQPHAQGKLVGVLQGEVWDVAVDIQVGSPTFGRWVGCTLSAENRRQLFIPEGYAHGFVVISETALVLYKCTELYHPGAEGTVLWSDPDLGIPWPIQDPELSPKDAAARPLSQLDRSSLPRWQPERQPLAGS